MLGVPTRQIFSVPPGGWHHCRFLSGLFTSVSRSERLHLYGKQGLRRNLHTQPHVGVVYHLGSSIDNFVYVVDRRCILEWTLVHFHRDTSYCHGAYSWQLGGCRRTIIRDYYNLKANGCGARVSLFDAGNHNTEDPEIRGRRWHQFVQVERYNAG
jgi:hypothetical protein